MRDPSFFDLGLLVRRLTSTYRTSSGLSCDALPRMRSLASLPERSMRMYSAPSRTRWHRSTLRCSLRVRKTRRPSSTSPFRAPCFFCRFSRRRFATPHSESSCPFAQIRALLADLERFLSLRFRLPAGLDLSIKAEELSQTLEESLQHLAQAFGESSQRVMEGVPALVDLVSALTTTKTFLRWLGSKSSRECSPPHFDI